MILVILYTPKCHWNMFSMFRFDYNLGWGWDLRHNSFNQHDQGGEREEEEVIVLSMLPQCFGIPLTKIVSQQSHWTNLELYQNNIESIVFKLRSLLYSVITEVKKVIVCIWNQKFEKLHWSKFLVFKHFKFSFKMIL